MTISSLSVLRRSRHSYRSTASTYRTRKPVNLVNLFLA